MVIKAHFGVTSAQFLQLAGNFGNLVREYCRGYAKSGGNAMEPRNDVLAPHPPAQINEASLTKEKLNDR
jgi:hypothetical protein